jgi:molybdate transport system substrate-binding protein
MSAVRPHTAEAAEVKVVSTLGLMGAARELAPRYERMAGTRIAADFAPTARLVERIRAGEAADVAILTAAGIDELTGEGTLARGSRVDLARSVVGVAVRAGAPRPDIGSAEAFTRALLGAGSLAYSRAGASGIFFAALVQRLGIADQVNAKATVIPSGLTGELAARGEVELAVQQVSELMEVPGIDVVGPLPPELQEVTVFSGGLFAASPRRTAGMALLRFFASAEAGPVYERRGLGPMTGTELASPSRRSEG